MRRVLLASTLLVAGCGGSDDDAVTSTTDRSTTTVTPLAAFEADLRRSLSEQDDAFYADAADLAQTLCRDLTEMPASVAEDDAANDTEESDAEIGATLQQMSIGIAFGDFEPQVEAVLLRATASNFCPEHSAAIEAYLRERT